jgi:hypothetical protein
MKRGSGSMGTQRRKATSWPKDGSGSRSESRVISNSRISPTTRWDPTGPHAGQSAPLPVGQSQQRGRVRRRGGTRGGPGLAGSPGPVERPGPGPCSDEHWAAPRNHTSKPLNPCPRERTSLLADTPLQVQVVAQFPIRRESGGSAPSRSAADALRQRPPDQLPDRGLRLTLETGQKGG